MSDPEKLTALKKVYADIILNTSKEAAVRVMICEKKAREYQQELVAVRDEALRTLLRLKQMFDSKVKETEMISMKKLEKINELEAQLGEAEDVVGELRMELRECQNQLEKALLRSQTYHTNDDNSSEAVPILRDDLSNNERTIESSSVVVNGVKESISHCSYKENKDPFHCSLPSMLSKCRNTKVLKEDCLVIKTLERNMKNGDLSASENSDVSKRELKKDEKDIKFTFKRKRKTGDSSVLERRKSLKKKKVCDDLLDSVK